MGFSRNTGIESIYMVQNMLAMKLLWWKACWEHASQGKTLLSMIWVRAVCYSVEWWIIEESCLSNLLV